MTKINIEQIDSKNLKINSEKTNDKYNSKR